LAPYNFGRGMTAHGTPILTADIYANVMRLWPRRPAISAQSHAAPGAMNGPTRRGKLGPSIERAGRALRYDSVREYRERGHWVTTEFVLLLAIGFVAQLVDGTLGMAYGVMSNAALLTMGLPPAQASALVHAAEVFTTGASAAS